MPGFKGEQETLIQEIPISAQAPNVDSIVTALGSAGAGSSSTWASKHKSTASQGPPAKARRHVGKKSIDIKITEPAPQTHSGPTPPGNA
jgi:hypothetical protein